MAHQPCLCSNCIREMAETLQSNGYVVTWAGLIRDPERADRENARWEVVKAYYRERDIWRARYDAWLQDTTGTLQHPGDEPKYPKR